LVVAAATSFVAATVIAMRHNAEVISRLTSRGTIVRRENASALRASQ